MRRGLWGTRERDPRFTKEKLAEMGGSSGIEVDEER